MAAAIVVAAITCPLCGERIPLSNSLKPDQRAIHLHLPPATTGHLAAHWT